MAELDLNPISSLSDARPRVVAQLISCGVGRDSQAAPANAADGSTHRSKLCIENRQQDFENKMRLSIESNSKVTRKHQNRMYTEGIITPHKGIRGQDAHERYLDRRIVHEDRIPGSTYTVQQILESERHRRSRDRGARASLCAEQSLHSLRRSKHLSNDRFGMFPRRLLRIHRVHQERERASRFAQKLPRPRQTSSGYST